MPVRDAEMHKQRARAMVNELVGRMELGWWKWIIAFDPKNDSNDRVLCETTTDWEYRQTSLIFNLPQLAAATDDELYEVIVHEIVHVLIAPLFNSLSDSKQTKVAKLNEYATENVARVLLTLLGRGITDDFVRVNGKGIHDERKVPPASS